MTKIEHNGVITSLTIDKGAAMAHVEGDSKASPGLVVFSWKYIEKDDIILINLTQNSLGMVAEINSDHIQMFKDIIETY